MKHEENIVRLYQKGYTMEQISEKLIVSVSKIQYVLKAHNQQNGNKKYQITKDIENRVISSISQGLKQKDISAMLDISIYTVKDIIKRKQLQNQGLANRNLTNTIYQEINFTQALQMFQEGMSFQEILLSLHFDELVLIHIFKQNLSAELTYQHKYNLLQRLHKLLQKNYTLVEISNMVSIPVCSLKLLINNREFSK